MSNISRGVYRHLKTGNLYNVVFQGRLVSEPLRKVVIYEQMYDSVLRGSNVKLEKGSIWVRDVDDFTIYGANRRFEKVKME